ncbi:MAG: SPFH domain-containing protein [Thermoplasmata archaeon]|nr:SPFH domain-containing protein [Thermoplasmata archaeon]
MDSVVGLAVALGVILVFVCTVLLAKSAHQIQPYEQGVVSLLGSYRRTINPGFHMMGPFNVVIRVDLRPRSVILPPFPAPTVSGQPATVGAQVDYKVVNAARATFLSVDVGTSVQRSVKETVGNEVAHHTLETLLPNGWSIAQRSRERLVQLSGPMGIEILRLSITIQGVTGQLEFFAN